MAAPSETSWSGIVNSNYRMGIYVSLTSSATQTAVSIQTWIWSKWSLNDETNYYYFDNEATAATTRVKEHIDIVHTNSSGSSWNTINQTLLGTHSYVYDHTTSVQTISCATKITSIGSNASTVSHTTSYTIPALESYTVSYNANGGTGAPSSQTKWHSITLTLSSTIPTRSGYTFLGWARSATATQIDYKAGAFFGYNEDTVLYAVWQPNSYLVSYDPNGGTGAPSSQNKLHDIELTLSTETPTRTNYNFLGWGTSPASSAVTYAPGAKYTSNTAITLYAIWELAYTSPRITNLAVYRCDSAGMLEDTGSYIRVRFSWATDYAVTSVQFVWGPSDGSNNVITATGASGTSGSVDQIIGDGTISIEYSYIVSITVADTQGNTVISRTVPGAVFGIDFLAGGGGVAIGKPAQNKGFEVAMNSNLEGTLTVRTAKTNPITSVDADTVESWQTEGMAVVYNGKLDQLVDQLSQWGYILNLAGYSTNVHQLWFSQPNGDLAHRGGNHNGWSGTWKTLLDSDNCDAYCLPITGGTTTGYVKLGNTVNALGQLRQHTDWLGFYASVADAQGNTNRSGWIGFGGSANFSVMNNSSGSNITNVAWTVSSDERLKTDIENISDIFLDIWDELQPKVFKWSDVNSMNAKFHFGLIAQDVISAFENRGLNYKDYGFVNSFTLPDDNTEYFGIAYDEYHILTSAIIRRTNVRVDKLEAQVEELLAAVQSLKGMV